MKNTAQYKRWKYMIEHDIPVPVELDKAILDKMDGNDYSVQLSANEINALPNQIPCPMGGCETSIDVDPIEYWLDMSRPLAANTMIWAFQL